ncbi:MAG: polysaccharide biosynthesis protein [Bacilli bacterium]|nr:polysaccharide biosynthesis protein [Bacilli bacterium]
MKKETFLKGALIATICIVLSKILGVLYVIPFHAIIGERGGALYGYAYSLYTLFLTLSTVGIPLAIAKLVSEYDTLGYHHVKEKAYKIAYRIVFIMSIISFLTLFIFAPFLSHLIIGDISGGHTWEEITYVVRISSTAILFVTMLSVMRGYLQGHRYIAPSSISEVIEQVVRILVILVGSYISIYILHQSIKEAVGIAVFGATVGAMITLVYLHIKMKKSGIRTKKVYEETEAEKSITSWEIVKKLVTYTLPFILMSVVGSSYGLVDMFTVVKTLVNEVGMDVTTAEVVMSVLTTWGSKLNTIVISIANGIVVSLLPNMTRDYVSKNFEGVRKKINKTLQIIFYCTIPMATGLSLLSVPVWNIFYGASDIGPKVFSYSVFVTIFASLFLNFNVAMQSLGRLKKVYVSLILGLLFNAFMNIPFMLLFDYVGIPAYYGAITSTIIGYMITITMNLYTLKKDFQVNYRTTIRHFGYCMIANIAMTFVLLLLEQWIPISGGSKLYSVLVICFYGIVGSIIYFLITWKTGTIKTVFGKQIFKKIPIVRNFLKKEV